MTSAQGQVIAYLLKARTNLVANLLNCVMLVTIEHLAAVVNFALNLSLLTCGGRWDEGIPEKLVGGRSHLVTP